MNELSQHLALDIARQSARRATSKAQLMMHEMRRTRPVRRRRRSR